MLWMYLCWLFMVMFATAHDELDGMTSSNHNELVLIKYGGSAITEKISFETIKLDVVKKLAETIANLTDQHKRIILIHGAGSFGHFQAKEYELKSGGHEHNWQEGLAKTRQSVHGLLNNHVVAAHVAAGVVAVGIPLFPHLRTRGFGNLVEGSGDALINNIVRMLHDGIIPVLHGDVVLDEVQRCSVFGGDLIMTWLASNLPKALQTIPISVKTIFVTDVMGVYDMPPHLPNASLLREIIVQPISGDFLLPQTDQHLHDVTGGIMKKIECARDLALMGCVVSIVPVDALSDTLNGNLPHDKGTTVIMQ